MVRAHARPLFDSRNRGKVLALFSSPVYGYASSCGPMEFSLQGR